MVIDKNIVLYFPIKAYVKHVTPRMEPVFAPGASFEQTWQRSTRGCYIPNIKALCCMVSDMKICSCFHIIKQISMIRKYQETFLCVPYILKAA